MVLGLQETIFMNSLFTLRGDEYSNSETDCPLKIFNNNLKAFQFLRSHLSINASLELGSPWPISWNSEEYRSVECWIEMDWSKRPSKWVTEDAQVPLWKEEWSVLTRCIHHALHWEVETVLWERNKVQSAISLQDTIPLSISERGHEAEPEFANASSQATDCHF